jgi:HAMP domain-containing protein
MVFGLRAKFNLALLAIFTLAALVAVVLANRQFERDARANVTRQAELMMDAALAVRGYTTANVKPHLDPMLAERFLPETVPAFAATETLVRLQRKYPEYSYREAALNPTNPRDRAVAWEAALIERFRADPQSARLMGEHMTESGPSWYVAQPIRISDGRCLVCHSHPAAAPASMLVAYGSSNGFGWQMDEVIGAQIVKVPMALPLAQAAQALQTFALSMGLVLAVTLIALNVMLTTMIVRPIAEVARAAEAISMARPGPDLAEGGHDEIATLRMSFNRMRRSLSVALAMAGRRR